MIFEGTMSGMGHNGDWTAYSKLAKLTVVLLKVIDVMRMMNGDKGPDPDVPLPEHDTWVDERRPIKPPVYPGTHTNSL